MVEHLSAILRTLFAMKFIQSSNSKFYIYRRLFLDPYFEIHAGELAWINLLINLQNKSNSVTGEYVLTVYYFLIKLLESWIEIANATMGNFKVKLALGFYSSYSPGSSKKNRGSWVVIEPWVIFFLYTVLDKFCFRSVSVYCS